MIPHRVVEGTGPAVLLLHSTATDARQWQPQISELRRDFTVVAPDLRGYGRSPLGWGRFSHAHDLVRLIDHLSLTSRAVVGSSGGGVVALQVASNVPERVSALVLLCAAADGVEPTADLRAFAERETALLQGGDVAGATELNASMWLQREVAEGTQEPFRERESNTFRLRLAARDKVHEEDLRSTLPASRATPQSFPELAT